MKFYVHHREGRITATEWATRPSYVRGCIPVEADPDAHPKTHVVENGKVVERVTLTGNAG